MKTRVYFLSFILIVLPVTASAELIDQVSTATITFTSTGTKGPVTPSPVVKFNPALGTLDSVSFLIQVQTTATASGTYTGASGTSNLSVSTSDTVNLGGQSVTATNNNTRSNFSLTNGSTYTLPYTLGGIQSQSVANIVPFIGTGNVTPFTWTENLTVSGFGGFSFFSFNGTSQLEVTTRYSYTPVPEPATLAILGLGTGLALLKRKRRAVK